MLLHRVAHQRPLAVGELAATLTAHRNFEVLVEPLVGMVWATEMLFDASLQRDPVRARMKQRLGWFRGSGPVLRMAGFLEFPFALLDDRLRLRR